MTLQRILLCVTGGIAAYKSASLARLLVKQGHDVQVLMTSGAKQFIKPLTFQALTGRKVRDDLWDDAAEASMGHIELARWADHILIAPATAQCLASLAHGFAYDLLTTVCLASQTPMTIAPAMNEKMWLSSPVKANCEKLREFGVTLLGPGDGQQACGDIGLGRMLEPEEIATYFLPKAKPLAGIRILITAGPTQEYIDPIRFMTNRSSGKMGFSLASAAIKLGASVTLISGPVTLLTPASVQRFNVVSAVEMYQSVHHHIAQHDWFISSAAVADYCCESIADNKIKKGTDSITLKLRLNPDILASVAALTCHPKLIGFSAETESLLERAEEKRVRKKCEFMIANDVSRGQVMGESKSKAFLLSSQGVKDYPEMSKRELATKLLLDMMNQVKRGLIPAVSQVVGDELKSE